MKVSYPSTVILGSVFLSILGGCENNPKTAMGGLIGGGSLGGAGYFLSKGVKGGKYTIPITVASTVIGGLIGSGIGQALDKTDQIHVMSTTHHALENVPSNVSSTWSNPKTLTSGSVTPKETFQKSSGEWCRKYSFHILHDQKVSSGNGLACRDNSGKWVSVGTPSLSTL